MTAAEQVKPPELWWTPSSDRLFLREDGTLFVESSNGEWVLPEPDGLPVDAVALVPVSLVLADREAELRALKGPCSDTDCRLHYAHRGPCDIRPGEG